jgi:hypothetical protein
MADNTHVNWNALKVVYGSGDLWGDFMSLYFRFYEVAILESTYATGEGKNASVFLNVKLHL